MKRLSQRTEEQPSRLPQHVFPLGNIALNIALLSPNLSLLGSKAIYLVSRGRLF